MAKSRLSATCAAVFLSLTFMSAQSASLNAQAHGTRDRKNHDRTTDTTPQATVNAAKGDVDDAVKTPQMATLSGCVVRDAANGGHASVKSNGISYKLTAKNDQDFSEYMGKKVEVTGALMTGQAPQRATSGKSDELGVPKDQTAVGGQSDVPVTGAARDNTKNPTDSEVHGTPNDQIPLATDKGTTADLTGRIDVKTIKTVAGSCL